MKNTKAILMSVLMIGIVATAVGATLADFSDIETSKNNFFGTGELNLKVSDYLGNEFEDPDFRPIIQVDNSWPCCTKDYYFDLHHAGEGDQFIPWAYVHLKNFDCYDVPAKDGSPKPEPEVVAESGGICGELLDGTLVTCAGMGLDWGTLNCELAEHVDIVIMVAGPYEVAPEKASDVPATDWVVLPNLLDYDLNGDNVIKLNELKCVQVELGQIPDCWTMWVDFRLHLQDVDEDDVGFHYFDENIPAEKKWDHWPTNALQKDVLKFDISFELLQSRFVP